MEKMMIVNEVAKLAGISIRTLHYYDEIGLLKPKYKTKSKYALSNAKSTQKCRWRIILSQNQ